MLTYAKPFVVGIHLKKPTVFNISPLSNNGMYFITKNHDLSTSETDERL